MYEDLMGDVEDFAAAFEYWMNAYHARGIRIDELQAENEHLKQQHEKLAEVCDKLEGESSDLKIELQEKQDEIRDLWQELSSYRHASGF